MAKTYRDIPALTAQQLKNFWNKVDKTPGHGPNGDCWIWTAAKDRGGYGNFCLKPQKRQCQAHRVAYAITYPDKFDPSLNVCHYCNFGHGGCVRPDHLWQGTTLENNRYRLREYYEWKNANKKPPRVYREIPYLWMKDIDRFWSHIDKRPGHGPNGDCWIWKGATERDGYARLIVKVDYKKWRNLPAHRISFLLHNGSIDNKLAVCHACDNRRCVNPSHLWQGTLAENSNDMASKGRVAHGARNSGAKLTEEQVLEIRALLDGGAGDRELAERFGVTQWAIYAIRIGITWKRLE